MKKILFTACFLSIALFVSSQEYRLVRVGWHSLSLDAGYNQIKERNLPPQVHTGFLAGLNYGFTYKLENISEVQFGIHGSGLKSNLETGIKSANARVQLNYKYLFLFFDNEVFSYHFGFDAGLNYSASTYPAGDESLLYWANYFALGINNRYTYNINSRNRLTFGFSLPFFIVTSRPEQDKEYKVDGMSFGGVLKNMHSNLQPTFFKRNAVISASLEYQFGNPDGRMPAIYYTFYCSKLQSKEGNPYQDMTHTLGFKIYL